MYVISFAGNFLSPFVLSISLSVSLYLLLSPESAVPSRNNDSSPNPCSLIVAVSDAADVKFLEP